LVQVSSKPQPRPAGCEAPTTVSTGGTNVGLSDSTDRHLMSDPKARKVIVIENPLLPTRLKEVIAEVLFDNLQVRHSVPSATRSVGPLGLDREPSADSLALWVSGSFCQFYVCACAVSPCDWCLDWAGRRPRQPRKHSHSSQHDPIPLRSVAPAGHQPL